MKQIFTLLSAALFTATIANAQINEHFENNSTLPSNCWQLMATHDVTGTAAINGAASIASEPAANSEIRTPYLDITGPCQVSFSYLLNNKLNNNSIRTIEIGTTDKNGTFVAATSFVLNKNTNFNTVFSFNQSLALTTGVQRLTIRVNSASGDGNSFVTIDDLTVSSATLHYGAAPCNTPPVSTDANFFTASSGPFNGSIASKASDANAGETVSFVLDTLYTVNGTLTLRSNGTFTFTPAGNFAGGTVTFKYKVTDDGYDPLTSNVATVTINYPALAPLPVFLTSFSANVGGGAARFFWSVAQNENGNRIDLEKSSDGKTFSTAAVILTTMKTGAESYQYNDATFERSTYYRLRIVNNNGGIEYSRTIFLQNAALAQASNLTILQNPVLSTVNFEYTAAEAGLSTVTVYNLNGAKMLTTQIRMYKGRNTMSVNLDSRVAPGSYIMEVTNGTDRSIAKLIKQ